MVDTKGLSFAHKRIARQLHHEGDGFKLNADNQLLVHFAWWGAKFFPEGPGEIVRIRKTGFISYFRDIEAGRLQQGPGFLQTHF